jgi:hypothetical protein
MNLSNLQHQSCEVATGEETDTESLASGWTSIWNSLDSNLASLIPSY